MRVGGDEARRDKFARRIKSALGGGDEFGRRGPGGEGEDAPVGPDREMSVDQLGQTRIDRDDTGVFDQQRNDGRGDGAGGGESGDENREQGKRGKDGYAQRTDGFAHVYGKLVPCGARGASWCVCTQAGSLRR